jgi:hypothetical protein
MLNKLKNLINLDFIRNHYLDRGQAARAYGKSNFNSPRFGIAAEAGQAYDVYIKHAFIGFICIYFT